MGTHVCPSQQTERLGGKQMSIYDTLNEKQQEAVFCTEGPLLILARGRLRKNESIDAQNCVSD